MSVVGNTGRLGGFTLFITGTLGRSVGKALALKAAKDGANIVLASRILPEGSEQSDTIYLLAGEIEKAGGRAFAVPSDIRSEADVDAVIQKALHHFGGIDMLVNCASAVDLSGVLQTSMDKFDKLHATNARAAYMLSAKCFPHLKRSAQAQIVTMCPPLFVNPSWFSNHLAYTMSRYGMSMGVLGMSKEFKPFGVAVNGLWPRTAVWSPLTENGFGIASDLSQNSCRKPELVSDAAYLALCRDPKKYSGRFYICEDLLAEFGIKDLSVYDIKPGETLAPAPFLENVRINSAFAGGGLFDLKTDGEKTESVADSICKMFPFLFNSAENEAEKTVANSHGETILDSNNELSSKKIQHKQQQFLDVPSLFRYLRDEQTHCLDTDAKYCFNLTGKEPGHWLLSGAERKCDFRAFDKATCEKADVEFTLDSGDFLRLFSGEFRLASAFATGKLQAFGSPELTMKFEQFLELVTEGADSPKLVSEHVSSKQDVEKQASVFASELQKVVLQLEKLSRDQSSRFADWLDTSAVHHTGVLSAIESLENSVTALASLQKTQLENENAKLERHLSTISENIIAKLSSAQQQKVPIDTVDNLPRFDEVKMKESIFGGLEHRFGGLSAMPAAISGRIDCLESSLSDRFSDLEKLISEQRRAESSSAKTSSQTPTGSSATSSDNMFSKLSDSVRQMEDNLSTKLTLGASDVTDRLESLEKRLSSVARRLFLLFTVSLAIWVLMFKFLAAELLEDIHGRVTDAFEEHAAATAVDADAKNNDEQHDKKQVSDHVSLISGLADEQATKEEEENGYWKIFTGIGLASSAVLIAAFLL